MNFHIIEQRLTTKDDDNDDDDGGMRKGSNTKGMHSY